MGLWSNLMKKVNDKAEKEQNNLRGLLMEQDNIYMTSSVKEDRQGARATLLMSSLQQAGYPRYKVDYLGGYPLYSENEKDLRVVLLQQGILFDFPVAVGKDFIPYEYIEGVKQELRFGGQLLVIAVNQKGMKYDILIAGDFEHLYRELFQRLI